MLFFIKRNITEFVKHATLYKSNSHDACTLETCIKTACFPAAAVRRSAAATRRRRTNGPGSDSLILPP